MENGNLRGREHLTPQELRGVDSFQCFSEIGEALATLDLILVLARRKPPQSGSEPIETLRFYIESYLQATYILQQRLLRFVRYERKCVERRSEAWNKLKEAEKSLILSFTSSNELRSHHVHQVRYQTKELIQASAFDLIRRTRKEADPELQA